MKLLLDTHAFIWWDSDPNRLSQRVLGLCQSSSTTLLLSVASVWEMQIKQQLGKLQLRVPLAGLIAAQQQTNGLGLMALGSQPRSLICRAASPARIRWTRSRR
jgi:PIN domain nuclease of toxin-antitoxin system